MKFITLLLLLLSCNLNYGSTILKNKLTATKEELEEKSYPNDDTAEAAILEEDVKVYYNYFQGEGFRLYTEVFKKIKIYKKEGLHYGIQKLKLYSNANDTEKLEKIKAKTFNIVDGKIQEVSMDKKAIFKEKSNDNYTTVKFSLPNVVEGSVIVISYRTISPFITYLPEVYFQEQIPVKLKSVNFQIPEFFKFNVQTRGEYPINLVESSKYDKITFQHKYRLESGSTQYSTSQEDFSTNIYKTTVTDVAAFKKESYTDNVYNYISTLEFFLSSIKYPRSLAKNYAYTWDDVLKKNCENKFFKAEISKRNYFKEDLKKILATSPSYEEKVFNIYNFLKEKMDWNGKYSNKAYNGVKECYKKNSGASGDINIILLAMLKEAKIKARPVFVITKKKRRTIFPNYSAFNYTITEVTMADNSKVYLDATDKKASPNILPLRVASGSGKLMTDSGKSIDVNLSPKISTKNTMISYKIDEDGTISGKLKELYNTDYLAYRYRHQSSKDTTKAIEKLIEKNKIDEVTNFKREGFDKLSDKINVAYNFNMEEAATVVGDEIYFHPMLFTRTATNPFKLDKRSYPINFGFTFLDNYIININIPDGYTVSSIPESIKMALPENLGSFTFIARVAGNTIQLKVKELINKPFIPAHKYPQIKQLIDNTVKKENEQIVLKKV